MKLFSTKAHGVLDYLTVALLPAAPRLLGWDRTTTRFLDAAALGVLAYSLATDYELGAARRLSMEEHLDFDRAFAAAMFTGAKALPDSPAAARLFLAGMGLFATFAAATTEEVPSDRVRAAIPA